MKPKHALRLLLSGETVCAYTVKANGYNYLVVAPDGDMVAIQAAMAETDKARELADLKRVNAPKTDLALVKFREAPKITDIEWQNMDGLVVLASALQLLNPEVPKKKRKARTLRVKTAAPLKRAKQPMSQATKDKISASRRATLAAKKQSSLLQAVEKGSPVPVPAEQPE